MVSPARGTATPAPVMSKTRLAALPLTVTFCRPPVWPLTVSWRGPGPSMSRLLSITSSPLVRVMVRSVLHQGQAERRVPEGERRVRIGEAALRPADGLQDDEPVAGP